MPKATSHGIGIHYELDGSGPAVVLLHSFLCSGEMWRHQVPALAERWRVVNVDARGHGASDRVDARFDLDAMVDDVVAVLDAAGIEAAAWAGLSMGGMAALRAALTRPERVASLLLLDTDAGAETAWNRLQYRGLGLVARSFGLDPLRRTVARKMFGATTLREQPALVAEWTERFAGVHVPSVLRVLDSFLRREDLQARLAEVRVPALVLVGSEDVSLPPARSRRLAAALPDATCEEIPKAGHLSALERPEAVTRAMQSFLERVGPA